MLAIIILLSAIIFFYEIKHAPIIEDDNDCKLKEETVVKYYETFCQHCKFFDGTAMCLHEDVFGVLNNHIVDWCKKDSFFKVK